MYNKNSINTGFFFEKLRNVENCLESCVKNKCNTCIFSVEINKRPFNNFHKLYF